MFNLCHGCSCVVEHEGLLQRGLGGAGGSEETEHCWRQRGPKAPRGLLEAVRRERGKRMGCLLVAEWG